MASWVQTLSGCSVCSVAPGLAALPYCRLGVKHQFSPSSAPHSTNKNAKKFGPQYPFRYQAPGIHRRVTPKFAVYTKRRQTRHKHSKK